MAKHLTSAQILSIKSYIETHPEVTGKNLSMRFGISQGRATYWKAQVKNGLASKPDDLKEESHQHDGYFVDKATFDKAMTSHKVRIHELGLDFTKLMSDVSEEREVTQNLLKAMSSDIKILSNTIETMKLAQNNRKRFWQFK